MGLYDNIRDFSWPTRADHLWVRGGTRRASQYPL